MATIRQQHYRADRMRGQTEFGEEFLLILRHFGRRWKALTPQAIGWVERANQTLQNRLVKEMRLLGVSSIDVANAILPGFVAAWNTRFAVPPRNEADAHRPWSGTPEALDDTMARREERTLSKALTFSVGGMVYCVKTKGPGTALRGAKIELRHRLAGTVTAHYKDRILPVTACRTYPIPDSAENEKTIDLRIDAIVAAQSLARVASPAPGCGKRSLATAQWGRSQAIPTSQDTARSYQGTFLLGVDKILSVVVIFLQVRQASSIATAHFQEASEILCLATGWRQVA